MTRRALRRGNWSLQELERLRQLLPRSGVVATARLLRRSAVSVERKALDLLRQPLRRGPWQEADDQRLRASWGVVEARLLGPMLGRTPAEVTSRAGELRRRLRSGPWSPAEELRLKEWYGSRHDVDLEVALLRPRSEIAAAAVRLCLAKDKRLKGAGVGTGTAQVRRRMPRWTSAEEARLRVIYPDLDNLAVAKELARTVTSVANKAHQLGLAKSPALLASIGRQNVGVRYGSQRARLSAVEPALPPGVADDALVVGPARVGHAGAAGSLAAGAADATEG